MILNPLAASLELLTHYETVRTCACDVLLNEYSSSHCSFTFCTSSSSSSSSTFSSSRSSLTSTVSRHGHSPLFQSDKLSVHNLQQSFRGSALKSLRPPTLLHGSSTRSFKLRCEASSAAHKPLHTHLFGEAVEPILTPLKPHVAVTVLEETCPRTGKKRKYWLNDVSGEVCVEEASSKGAIVEGTFWFQSLPRRLGNFILPAGFPNGVTDDYLPYMLCQLPVHITGWTCSTLVTSTLLTAVGIGGSAAPAAAATAAIKWVTKDGIGALGRFLIGGRFGSMFDEDPKQWRMYADLIGSFGSVFELATPLAPGSFLLLASLGNLTKAVARGLKEPSWRVIQTHFADSENVGDIVAKGEVWQVGGQILGLAFGVILLRTPGIASSYWSLVGVWAAIRACHLFFRYRSLKTLRLPTINFKRAALLAEAHVGGLPLPDVYAINLKEELLVPWRCTRPRMQIGCSLDTLLAKNRVTGSDVQDLLAIYEHEEYMLTFVGERAAGPQFHVLLKEGATSVTLMRSIYQAEWILQNHAKFNKTVSSSSPTEEDSPLLSQSSSGAQGLLLYPSPRKGLGKKSKQLLQTSLEAMESSFDAFFSEADKIGWNTKRLVIRLPSGAPTVRQLVPGEEHSFL